MLIVEARAHLPAPHLTARAEGHRKDGSLVAVREVGLHDPGTLFLADPARAEALERRRLARPAKLAPQALALADAALPARSATEAAVAVFPLAWVWQAFRDGRHWRPVPETGSGPGRDPWDSRFRSMAEAERHFAANPGAAPLFHYLDDHGIRRAFVWVSGGLLPIPTEIHQLRR